MSSSSMTPKAFQRIALIGKVNHQGTRDTLKTLHDYLLNHQLSVVIEERTAKQISVSPEVTVVPIELIGDAADLAIVVGGDGNMLGAARVFCDSDIAVIGVNRGNLGFLTELDPEHVLEQLQPVLAGDYREDPRFLLEVEVFEDGRLTGSGRAINEIVLHSDKVAHMIEFDVFCNQRFVYSQRSDGLIIATPTGSTAYSLSGGGPVLAPNLNAISLVPMFPHTLSSRPLVISGESLIEIKPAADSDPLQISCDGHARIQVNAQAEIHVRQFSSQLKLIQPLSYSYFEVLRNKLKWSTRLF